MTKNLKKVERHWPQDIVEVDIIMDDIYDEIKDLQVRNFLSINLASFLN